MDTTAAPAPATQTYAAALDDVWMPPPPLSQVSVRETYAFKAIARDKTGEEPELATRIYITSDSADQRSPQEQAAEWIRKTQSDAKAQFKLVEQGGVSLPGVPPIRDQDNKIVREPYFAVFESQGAKNYPGEEGDHSESKRHIQRFYFLPVSLDQVVVVRQVRRLEYELPDSQFWKQWQHFLATLKVEAANEKSSITGSGPRLRRYYTAHLSFEIPTPDENKGNQWTIKQGAKRSETWRTPQGEFGVGYSIVSGYTFSVAKENEHLRQVAKDLVANLAGTVKALNPNARVGELTYLQKKIGPYEIYGHKDAGGNTTSVTLELAYKTGKQFTLTFGGPSAAVNAAEPAIYAWLAQFRFLP